MFHDVIISLITLQKLINQLKQRNAHMCPLYGRIFGRKMNYELYKKKIIIIKHKFLQHKINGNIILSQMSCR